MGKSVLLGSASSNGAIVNDAITTRYPATGVFNNDSTDTYAAQAVRFAGTMSNLFAYVHANTTGVTSVLTMVQNYANSSITVSYAAAETGIKEDTSNTESFAATDECNIKFAVPSDAGTTAVTISLSAMQFEPTSASDTLTCTCQRSDSTFSTDSVTRYGAISGTEGAVTTEANVNHRVRASFTASNLYVGLSTNARTTDIVYKTRKNNADGAQSVTYTSGQTGIKEDTSNSDSLSSGDDFNTAFVTSTGGGSFTREQVSLNLLNTSNQFDFATSIVNGSSTSFNVTTYYTVGSQLSPSTTEATKSFYPRFDFTAKELVSYVSANTIATSASVFTLRDNGSDSSVTVSYAAAETGLKNDSTNTASVTSATDEICIKLATPNTSGSITTRSLHILGETASASTFTPQVMMM